MSPPTFRLRPSTSFGSGHQKEVSDFCLQLAGAYLCCDLSLRLPRQLPLSLPLTTLSLPLPLPFRRRLHCNYHRQTHEHAYLVAIAARDTPMFTLAQAAIVVANTFDIAIPVDTATVMLGMFNKGCMNNFSEK